MFPYPVSPARSRDVDFIILLRKVDIRRCPSAMQLLHIHRNFWKPWRHHCTGDADCSVYRERYFFQSVSRVVGPQRQDQMRPLLGTSFKVHCSYFRNRTGLLSSASDFGTFSSGKYPRKNREPDTHNGIPTDRMITASRKPLLTLNEGLVLIISIFLKRFKIQPHNLVLVFVIAYFRGILERGRLILGMCALCQRQRETSLLFSCMSSTQ